nr:hypothetical protein [Tanacetum cinerariifolium]
MMMVLVRQTEECDMMLHMKMPDIWKLVTEIEVGDKTADDVDKLACAADVVKSKQVGVKLIDVGSMKISHKLDISDKHTPFSNKERAPLSSLMTALQYEKKKYPREENVVDGYGNDMVLSDNQILEWIDKVLSLLFFSKTNKGLNFGLKRKVVMVFAFGLNTVGTYVRLISNRLRKVEGWVSLERLMKLLVAFSSWWHDALDKVVAALDRDPFV